MNRQHRPRKSAQGLSAHGQGEHIARNQHHQPGRADDQDVMRQGPDRVSPGFRSQCHSEPKHPDRREHQHPADDHHHRARQPLKQRSERLARGSRELGRGQRKQRDEQHHRQHRPGCGGGKDVVGHHREQDVGHAGDLARFSRAAAQRRRRARRDRSYAQQGRGQDCRHGSARQQNDAEQADRAPCQQSAAGRRQGLRNASVNQPDHQWQDGQLQSPQPQLARRFGKGQQWFEHRSPLQHGSGQKPEHERGKGQCSGHPDFGKT